VTRKSPNGEATTKFELDTNNKIYIEVEKPITPIEPLFRPGNFDRQADGNDPQDFRWIVDIERELNNAQPVTFKRPEFPVTEMYVANPLLYADEINFIQDKVNLVDADSGKVVRPFGKLAEAIKADINSEQGGAVVLRVLGPLGFSLRLPQVSGQEHIIAFDNTCPQPPVPIPETPPANDFKLYYSVIEKTQGKEFDLQIEPDEGLNPDSICNGSTLGIRTSLFPLPT
jgi:hypothetical protein